MRWRRRPETVPPRPDTAIVPTTALNVPCPECGTTVPLTVEHGLHYVVFGPLRGVCIRIDQTDIEAHLLTHRTTTRKEDHAH